MNSTVKIEVLDSEESHCESANACLLEIKEEQLEHSENSGNREQLKLEENLMNVKVEKQDCYNCNPGSDPTLNCLQQNLTALEGVLLNSSSDVQLEVEVATSGFHCDEDVIKSEQTVFPEVDFNFKAERIDDVHQERIVKHEPVEFDRQETGKLSQDIAEKISALSESIHSNLSDVKVEVEVSTSEEKSSSVVNDDNPQENSDTSSFPHLTEDGDYIDESVAVDQACYDSLQYLRSARARDDIAAGCLYFKNSSEGPVPHKTTSTVNCEMAKTNPVEQHVKLTRRKSTLASRLLANPSLSIPVNVGLASRESARTNPGGNKRRCINLPFMRKRNKLSNNKARIIEEDVNLEMRGMGKVTSQEIRDLLLPPGGKPEPPIPFTSLCKTVLVPCNWCTEKFHSRIALNQHLFHDHSACVPCVRMFKSNFHRDQHMKLHEKLKPKDQEKRLFQCIECTTKCSSIELLDKHMEKNHPIKVTPDLSLLG